MPRMMQETIDETVMNNTTKTREASFDFVHRLERDGAKLWRPPMIFGVPVLHKTPRMEVREFLSLKFSLANLRSLIPKGVMTLE